MLQRDDLDGGRARKRGSVALGLPQRHAYGFHPVEIGAFGQIVIGLPPIGQISCRRWILFFKISIGPCMPSQPAPVHSASFSIGG
jgi:hypothetical protein